MVKLKNKANPLIIMEDFPPVFRYVLLIIQGGYSNEMS